ncbi:MAG: cell envelope integrity protein CreD, partial [Alistipes sp.]|nr:cell envelope integrity protein CreD [Alistipes sp.]
MEIIKEAAPASLPEKPEMKKQRGNNALSHKVLFIGLIMLLLLIPGGMILSLIAERESLMSGAQEEVARMWSAEQHVTGPVVTIPGYQTVKDDANRVTVNEYLTTILPEKLTVQSSAACRQLRRGLYDTNVYNAEIVLSGTFELPAGLKAAQDVYGELRPLRATVAIGIADLRGIEESVEIVWEGRRYPTVTTS